VTASRVPSLTTESPTTNTARSGMGEQHLPCCLLLAVQQVALSGCLQCLASDTCL
jgi:hypothetical protein